jgi:excisionase family DNA binding protein
MMNEHITPSHLSPYLTLGEAALYARCSTRTVQRWLSNEKLNRYGHGRLVLILKAELEALLSAPQSA